MFRIAALSSLLVLAVFVAQSPAQIIIDRNDREQDRRTVPPPQPTPGHQIKSVELDATIRDQVAEVSVTHVFHNPTSRTIEAEYLFPLPERGTVQSMVLLVDGKELPGRILPKDEAREIYEGIVRAQKDPALLEYMGRGLFRTRVFPIPPGEDRTVTLRSTFVCDREEGVVEFAFPLAAHGERTREVGELSVHVDIHSKDAMKAVYSPSHQIVTERIDDHHARISHEQKNVTPSGDLRLLYTLSEGLVGANVLSYRGDGDEDGYFMLLASPQVEVEDADAPERTKTVIFVVDRSGSMRGKKIEQAREAAKFVLGNLNQDDLFNIVDYDSEIRTFRPELERVSAETRSAALDYVGNLRAGGSTNIDGALEASLDMLAPEGGPAYIVFLTDGRPTAGVTDEMQIARNAEQRNKADARVFCFGVGHDVNSRLLDRITGSNGGVTEYVGPDDNLEVAVSRFYGRITSPVMTNLDIAVEPTAINRAYPKRLPDLFAGGQIIWVGRYTDSGEATFTLNGKVGSDRQSMKIETTLADTDAGRTYDFVERIWAQRRVGAIIDEIDLHGENEELVDELVELSKRYGILTPYTSFLADEDTSLAAGNRENLNRVARTNVQALEEAEGAAGFRQRQIKQQLNQAAAPQQAPQGVAVGGATRGGGVGGGGGGAQGAFAYDLEGEARTVQTVRQVDNKTFFRRDGQWVQSGIEPEEVEQAEVVERFSDRYFELAAEARDGRALAQDGEVVLRIAGRVYKIVETAEN